MTGPRSDPPRSTRRAHAGVLLALLALLATGASAHDTWFAPFGSGGPTAFFVLGTGNRFPKQEFPLALEHVEALDCADADGRASKPAAVRRLPSGLLLRLPAAGDGVPARSCWARLVTFEIDVDIDKVPLYLAEIHAGDALRTRWAALQRRGVGWHERYTKHARVEIAAGAVPADAPSPLAFDLRLERADGPVRPGQTRAFTLLSDGRPQAGQWLELVADDGASAGWQRSDDAGRVRFVVPRAGRWLLRGVDLRPGADDGWDSRFVTLAFDAASAR